MRAADAAGLPEGAPNDNIRLAQVAYQTPTLRSLQGGSQASESSADTMCCCAAGLPEGALEHNYHLAQMPYEALTLSSPQSEAEILGIVQAAKHAPTHTSLSTGANKVHGSFCRQHSPACHLLAAGPQAPTSISPHLSEQCTTE